MNHPSLRTTLIATRDKFAAFQLAASGRAHALAGRARAIAADQKTWDALIAIIRGRRLAESPNLKTLASLAIRAELSNYVGALYPDVRPHLSNAIARNERQDALLELATAQISQTFAQERLHPAVALLKGSATARLVYEQSSHRQRRDLDLLIQPDDFTRVRAALWNSGWRDAPAPELGGPPFSGRTFGMRLALGAATMSLDLHRNLVSPAWCGLTGSDFRQAFLSNALPQPGALPITDHIDTFIHTVAHIGHAGFLLPMKAFVDLHLLWPQLDQNECAKRVARYRLKTATWICLRILDRWFGHDTGALQRELRPHHSRARTLDALTNCAGPFAVSPALPTRLAVHGFPQLLTDRT